jgi:hypothetical protein
MKSLITIICSMLILLSYSCKKNAANPSKSTTTLNKSFLIGNWSIVSDSTYTGSAMTNQPYNYAGQPGDYFNINANGFIYTKEGSALDTLSYHLIADTGIVISSFGPNINGTIYPSHITKIDSTDVIITSPKFTFAAGIFWRKATLSKHIL